MLDKSAFQRSTEALVVDPHAHYMAQAEQAQFRTEALDLIRRLKKYADRAASPIGHELCAEACEFIAKYTRTKP
ncbi:MULTISPECIES: hypothetical protein [unclassified Pseudomonas]|uniref:hypothetical protein n=1 Tax=unclassified Pseudomonas TaxID=196821 RepID=UPI000730B6FF|nr:MULTISPECIES: hypothetical protein [unclassified Pseudomonas]KSW22636.1 hypothetical protein AOX63_04205 [Pseudomonas sp. ADP]OBP11389.1 hypothetical protein BAE52_09770 [Pseudomonas sp. EGD-AKN5]QOF85452.1 hypothetical protein IG194_01650 [Pseudomonas sp. ADPe]